MPLVTRQALAQSDVVAAIALGCVIRGEAAYDEHINRAVSLALMNGNRKTGSGRVRSIDIHLGQAINRSGGTVGNKGHEAAAQCWNC